MTSKKEKKAISNTLHNLCEIWLDVATISVRAFHKIAVLKQRDTLGYIQRAEVTSTCHMSQQREQTLAPAIYPQPSWCELCTARSHSTVFPFCNSSTRLLYASSNRHTVFTGTNWMLSAVVKDTNWDRKADPISAYEVTFTRSLQVRKGRNKKCLKQGWATWAVFGPVRVQVFGISSSQ